MSDMSIASENKVAIIGGGIGGLTMALALQKQGIPFQLFEKSDAFKEVGAGVGLSSNALAILDKLGVGNTVREKSYFIDNSIVCTEKLSVLKKIPFPQEVYCVYRPTLIDILADAVNPDFYELNKEVKTIDNNKPTQLYFQDKSTKQFQTLIAADGINSTIRKNIFPEIKKREAKQVIWRGITPFDIKPEFAHTYYELGGDGVRFLFLPIDDHTMFWLVVQKQNDNIPQEDVSIKPHLLKLFKNYHPYVKEMIAQTDEKNIIKNELADLNPANYNNWFKNHTVFIGDSIHATTPNLAQGACQAIEDAYTLAVCLKLFDNKKAFETYQRLRINKVKYIVNQSWQIGQLGISHNILKERLFQTLLKSLPLSFYTRRYKKLIDISYLKSIENDLTQSLANVTT